MYPLCSNYDRGVADLRSFDRTFRIDTWHSLVYLDKTDAHHIQLPFLSIRVLNISIPCHFPRLRPLDTFSPFICGHLLICLESGLLAIYYGWSDMYCVRGKNPISSCLRLTKFSCTCARPLTSDCQEDGELLRLLLKLLI
jgi:hypothetical protein